MRSLLWPLVNKHWLRYGELERRLMLAVAKPMLVHQRPQQAAHPTTQPFGHGADIHLFDEAIDDDQPGGLAIRQVLGRHGDPRERIAPALIGGLDLRRQGVELRHADLDPADRRRQGALIGRQRGQAAFHLDDRRSEAKVLGSGRRLGGGGGRQGSLRRLQGSWRDVLGGHHAGRRGRGRLGVRLACHGEQEDKAEARQDPTGRCDAEVTRPPRPTGERRRLTNQSRPPWR